MGDGARVRLAVAVAAALLLTGCVTVVEPPPGDMTVAERDQALADFMDYAWQITELDDALRPVDPEVEFIAPNEWGPALATCMNDKGYPSYSGEANFLSSGHTVEPDENERLSLFLCSVGHQVDPLTYEPLNDAQRDFVYDYYQRSLVPCLLRAGVPVIDPPSRELFVANSTAWNPYLMLPDDVLAALLDDGEVIARCPPDPAGPLPSRVWFTTQSS